MRIMIQVIRNCQFVLEDGYKCNRPFSTNRVRLQQKFCEDHIGTTKTRNVNTSGLVKSSNAYTAEGNNIKMREWVTGKMHTDSKDKKYVKELESRITKLESIIKKKNRDFKQEIDAYFQKLLDEQKATTVDRTEKMIIAINNSLVNLNKKMQVLESEWSGHKTDDRYIKSKGIKEDILTLKRRTTNIGNHVGLGDTHHRFPYVSNQHSEEE